MVILAQAVVAVVMIALLTLTVMPLWACIAMVPAIADVAIAVAAML